MQSKLFNKYLLFCYNKYQLFDLLTSNIIILIADIYFQIIINGNEHHCTSASATIGIGTSTANTANGWKCPCCPVTSATAAAAQKHMDTHTGVKAFLCTLCRYKGNTLRGMRTHIRMHFDKRPSEINVRIANEIETFITIKLIFIMSHFFIVIISGGEFYNLYHRRWLRRIYSGRDFTKS